jgi:hypothetical protein
MVSTGTITGSAASRSEAKEASVAEQTYPIVDLTQQVPEADFPDFTSRSRVNPGNLADELVPIRDAFQRVLSGQDAAGGGFGLKTVEVTLTVTAEGGVAFIAKGSIEGSITLTFERP